MPAVATRPPKRKSVSARWRKLLSLIPGYDPFAQADGCWFDGRSANNALDFFPEMIVHVEGALANQPFILERWQQSLVANLFGWKRLDSLGREVRRYRECLLYVPRKCGKTPLAAAIGLYVFFCDNEPGAQCFIAAGEREQAGALFRHAKGMVLHEPELSTRCKIYGGNAAAGQSKSLVRESDGSFLRVIAADADTQHGGNSHLAIIDELHVQPNRDLVDVFRTSMSSQNRKQPLLIYITTADFDRESICNETYERACRVRDGLTIDPAFLPVIYEAKRDADWKDPEVWAQANPNLGVSKSLDYMERECKLAQENPAQENTFKRLDLNIKTEQDCRVIPMDKWDLCGENAAPVEWRLRMLEQLKGQRCMAGFDIASVNDLTSIVLLFGDDTEGYDLLPFFWGPQANAHERERKHGVNYLTWARQGFLTLTEEFDGKEVDFRKIRQDINELGDQFGIQKIAADRAFQGMSVCQDLMHDGFEIVPFAQGYLTMAAPTLRFMQLLSAGKLRHGNNPVLRWMAGNTAAEVEHAGPEAPLKFSKRKSKEKIDGIIAATMAVGLSMTQPQNYDFEPGSLKL